MKISSALLLASILLLPSCTLAGMATGAGATLGVAASQEGGLSRAATDLKIQAQINDLWFRSNVQSFLKLDLTVNQGRVLVTGVVQDPEERVEAIRLAWQPEGVKQVINEIQVAQSGGIVGFTRDKWITTRLRTALTLDRDVQSINYSIDTVSGVVYLIGVAQNQSELNRVIETARTVPDVKRVVSYVKLAGARISDPITGNNDVAPAPETVNTYEPQPLMDAPDGYQEAPTSSSYEGGYDSQPQNGYDDYNNTAAPTSYGASGGPQSLIEVEPLSD